MVIMDELAAGSLQVFFFTPAWPKASSLREPEAVSLLISFRVTFHVDRVRCAVVDIVHACHTCTPSTEPQYDTRRLQNKKHAHMCTTRYSTHGHSTVSLLCLAPAMAGQRHHTTTPQRYTRTSAPHHMHSRTHTHTHLHALEAPQAKVHKHVAGQCLQCGVQRQRASDAKAVSVDTAACSRSTGTTVTHARPARATLAAVGAAPATTGSGPPQASCAAPKDADTDDTVDAQGLGASVVGATGDDAPGSTTHDAPTTHDAVGSASREVEVVAPSRSALAPASESCSASGHFPAMRGPPGLCDSLVVTSVSAATWSSPFWRKLEA